MGKKQKRCKTSTSVSLFPFINSGLISPEKHVKIFARRNTSGSFIPGFIVTFRIFLQLFRFTEFAHFAIESFEGNFSVKKAGPYQRGFLRQKN